MEHRPADFENFVADNTDALLRAAYLIVSDLPEAEDLVQETLLKVAGRWHRVRRMKYPVAYARRILVNLALGGADRRSRELIGEPLADRRGAAYSWADGRTGDGVSAVELVLDDGRSVQATVANGWFVAWWPRPHGVRSADITTPAGTTTQTFALGHQSPCGPAPCSGGEGGVSNSVAERLGGGGPASTSTSTSTSSSTGATAGSR